jgi:hypothetical protein
MMTVANLVPGTYTIRFKDGTIRAVRVVATTLQNVIDLWEQVRAAANVKRPVAFFWHR